MPTYIVRARDNKGNLRKTKISANSPSEARTVLRGQGLYVQKLTEARGVIETLNSLKLEDLQNSMASVTVKDKAVFSRQFAVMVNAGVAMVRSLGILADQCPNPKLKKALQEISADVQQGTNLSDSMRKHPKCFDGLYVSMVQAGEVGGVLDEVMNRLAKLLEDVSRLQNQIKSAMTYPVAVGFIAVTVFLGMTLFLLPIFAKIFEDLDAKLPPFTAFMMGISKFLRTPLYMGILIVTIVALVIAYKQFYKTKTGRQTMDRFFLKMPLFGDLVQKTATARFCRTFGALSRSGVPILTALEIVRDTAGNQVIANAIDAARTEVQTGGMISLALQREQVFPVMAIQMISIGEETGEIDTMLMKVADFYEDEVEQAVKALTSVMEPIMIVVLGGMVGSILVAMYLPIFSIMDAIK
ncbi:type II secretion system F family protein [Thermocoleostomius sinensis]|jgi:type IV pilus assembly protein PilC|uniref:Type II secretion system F family protein n=1 Tax=Thermocoleostomius sinensis A174 TaxID=2016057 RepID=A0A9E8ZJK1_9CYAN|nr:type II secretion system F family protein [Thermocoleostomius sinensis]WAL59681.1 type II secretion system F family protein [Thermocoleostomius sinensis A174]